MTTIDVKVGEPVVRGPLAVFPLVGDAADGPDYVAGPVAAASGLLTVRERGDGTVPELEVEVAGTLPVLLVEGETLVGGKQHRTLNVSVLCPPGTTTTIPVSCLEAGRWSAPEATSRSARHAPGGLRARKTRSVSDAVSASRGRRSDQADVWRGVDEYAARHGVRSETHALEDVHAALDADRRDLVRGLTPTADQRGIVVAIGGEPVSLDLFDRPATLAAYWDALLAGAALDAVGAPVRGTDPEAVEAFVRAVADAPVTEADAAGLGREVHLRAPGVVGTGLRWHDALVHLAGFRVDDRSRHPSAYGGPPIRRRRRW